MKKKPMRTIIEHAKEGKFTKKQIQAALDEMYKYQLYIRKIGNKRWLKKGSPGTYRTVHKQYKKYGKDKTYDVRMGFKK